MKNNLILGLCVMMLTLACKKETTNAVIPDATLPGGKIVIPEIPAGTKPDTGDVPPAGDTLTNGFSYRKINKALGYNKPIFLDVDGDGNNDFTFSSVLINANDKPYLYLLVTSRSNSGNKVLVQNGPDLVDNALYTIPFDKDQTIEPTASNKGKWSDILQKGFILGLSKTNSTKEQYGLWINKADKYLGIAFKTGGELHYGWVKLTHDSTKDELLLTGFAYNKQAATSIKAGQK